MIRAFFRKQAAFLRKGSLLESRYKAGLALRLLGGLLPLAFFYFLAQIVDRRDPRLAPYGGDYFPFVALGVALAQYFARGSSSCLRELRNAQVSGVLEASLTTRTSPTSVIVHEALASFTFAGLHWVAVIAASVVLFGLDLSRANWPVAVLGLGLAAIAFVGMTAFAGGLIVALKSPEPANLILGGVGAFLAGSYFPVSVFPRALRTVAELLPMTHALEILRGAMLTGANVHALASPLWKLALLASFAACVGPWFFSWTVRRGRHDGSLSLH